VGRLGRSIMEHRYSRDGFNLVGFPCNQFGGQAPGTSEEERAWAQMKFGFEFDVYGGLRDCCLVVFYD
jgi:glutathione peroxidase-family protein